MPERCVQPHVTLKPSLSGTEETNCGGHGQQLLGSQRDQFNLTKISRSISIPTVNTIIVTIAAVIDIVS